jgi:hypothetical protein
MSVRVRQLLPVAAIAVVLALISWLSYCLRFNFDLTDEGLYLYSVVPHPHFPSANYYFLWFVKLNTWLGGGLLALRFATLLSILLASTVVFREYRLLDHEFRPPAQAVVGFSLFFLAGLSTYSIGLSSWSYNTVVLLAVALLFAGLMRRVRTATADAVTAVYVGVAVALALSARLSSGLLFAILGVGLLSAPTARATLRHRAGLVAVAGALGFGISYLALAGNPVYPAHFIDVLGLMSQSSHAGLLGNYLGNAARFGLERIALPGLAWWLARRVLRTRPAERVDRGFHLAYLLAGLTLVLPFDPVRGFLIVLGQLVLVLLYVVARRHDVIRKNVGAHSVAVSGAGLALMAAVGTNNNLLEMSVMYALLLVPLALVVLRFLGAGARAAPALLAYLTVFASSVIYHKQYREYYRSPLRAETRYVRASAPHLAGVWIPSELDALLTSVENVLRAQGFSRDRDAVLAYDEIPGIAAALGLPVFGAPWLFSGYDGVDAFNCYVIRNERHRYRHVYMLLASPLTRELERCADERLEPAPGHRVTEAGDFFHHWAERRVALRVVGPFYVKPPLVE